MPTEKDQKLISKWADRVNRGRQFRERLYTDQEWDRYSGYFRHRFAGLKESDHDVDRRKLRVLTDAIVAREGRKFANKLSTLPYLRVKPLAGRTPVHAKILERVINGILDTIKFGAQLDRGMLSLIQHGTVFFKPGYDSQFVPDFAQIAADGLSTGAFTKKAKRQEFTESIYPGMPWCVWQHAKNVIFPEMTVDFTSARWVAYQYLRSVADLRDDQRLKNTAQLKVRERQISDLDGGLAVDLATHEYLSDMAVCTEIHDKETGMMYIFVENHDQPIFEGEDVLMRVIGGKLPCLAMVTNVNTDYAWGTSDIQQVEEELRQLIDTRTQMVMDQRSRVPKILYREGTINKDDLLAMERGIYRIAIPTSQNPKDCVTELKFSPQMDLLTIVHDCAARIKEHFGADAFSTYPASRRSGGEVQGAQQDASIPVTRGIGKRNELVKELGMWIAEMVFAFWTDKAVVDILAPTVEMVPDPATGQMTQQDVTRQVWVQFTGHELRGNFDFTIQPSSGRIQDNAQSKREALELIQFFSQIPNINHQELMHQLGDRFDGLDVDKLFSPPPGNSASSPMGLNVLLSNKGMKRKTPKEI